jgi:putative PIN family toxin of toxin-antitoxin system
VPRAVLDTNVLVAALITPDGASARLLVALRAGAFESVVSPQLLDELRDVLAQPKFRRYVSREEAATYVRLIERSSIVLADPPPDGSGRYPADPDDRFLVDLARSALVDAIVSGDAQALALRPTVPVMSPREFLEYLGA